MSELGRRTSGLVKVLNVFPRARADAIIGVRMRKAPTPSPDHQAAGAMQGLGAGAQIVERPPGCRGNRNGQVSLLRVHSSKSL